MAAALTSSGDPVTAMVTTAAAPSSECPLQLKESSQLASQDHQQHHSQLMQHVPPAPHANQYNQPSLPNQSNHYNQCSQPTEARLAATVPDPIPFDRKNTASMRLLDFPPGTSPSPLPTIEQTPNRFLASLSKLDLEINPFEATLQVDNGFRKADSLSDPQLNFQPQMLSRNESIRPHGLNHQYYSIPPIATTVTTAASTTAGAISTHTSVLTTEPQARQSYTALRSQPEPVQSSAALPPYNQIHQGYDRSIHTIAEPIQQTRTPSCVALPVVPADGSRGPGQRLLVPHEALTMHGSTETAATAARRCSIPARQISQPTQHGLQQTSHIPSVPQAASVHHPKSSHTVATTVTSLAHPQHYQQHLQQFSDLKPTPSAGHSPPNSSSRPNKRVRVTTYPASLRIPENQSPPSNGQLGVEKSTESGSMTSAMPLLWPSSSVSSPPKTSQHSGVSLSHAVTAHFSSASSEHFDYSLPARRTSEISSMDGSEYTTSPAEVGAEHQSTGLSGQDTPPEQKRLNFLERNRKAALKCRQKKKEYISSLEDNVTRLSSENEQLQAQLKRMKYQILQMKTIMLAHKDTIISSSLKL
ncbi:hypothetical protein BASA62_005423 [Batrachochytrium salamandrivorans]|nr:hypothetical protein BASA62_005423 [Batrachochytrium salamandrivorans]